jgi:hypothetical protein
LQEDELVQSPQASDEAHRSWYRQTLEPPYQVFLIEHDWAAAFARADEFGDPRVNEQGKEIWDFSLPYPDCCFEFQFSGRRLCALVRFDGDRYSWTSVVKTSVGWVFFALSEPEHAAIRDRVKAIVRAVAVALDAEVAETQVIRAPHKLNRARDRRGRAAVADYHVVKLAHRSRVTPLHSGGHNDRSSVRLHFRRGHWRHFEVHKTWIKWTLVGDPDLGFIDKHYRL